MNTSALYSLVRVLHDIAARSGLDKGERGVTPAQLLIIEAISRNPGSTVQDTVKHTGLAQSYVSTIVAKFKNADVFITEDDQQDGRKSRISINPKMQNDTFKKRGEHSISSSIRVQFPELTNDKVDRVEALLLELSQILQ